MTAVAPSQVFSKSSFFATTSWEVKMGENERRQVDSPGQGASNDTSLMKIGAQTAKKRGWLQEIGLKFENFDPWHDVNAMNSRQTSLTICIALASARCQILRIG